MNTQNPFSVNHSIKTSPVCCYTPLPLCDFRHIHAVLGDVVLMFDEPVAYFLYTSSNQRGFTFTTKKPCFYFRPNSTCITLIIPARNMPAQLAR